MTGESAIYGKFQEYSELMAELEAVNAEFPIIKQLEDRIDAVKKDIQEYAKVEGNFSAYGYEVSLSKRSVWDTKKLEQVHPELACYKNTTMVASVRKVGEVKK